jgi:hypothetical protein
MPEVKNLDILYASIFGGVMPIPQHMKADGTMVATGENNPLPIMTLGMLPIQFQETLRTQLPTITHQSVIIGANAQNVSGWIDVRGYDKLAVNTTMTGGTGMTVKVETSFDNSTYFSEKTLYDGTANAYVDTIDVPAPFVRLLVKNKDATNPKTTNASIFAKS